MKHSKKQSLRFPAAKQWAILGGCAILLVCFVVILTIALRPAHQKLYNAAETYLNRGEYALAAETFAQARIKKDNHFPEADKGREQALRALADEKKDRGICDEELLTCYEQLAALCPQHADYAISVAETLASLGKTEEAAAKYKLLTEQFAGEPNCYFSYSNFLWNNGSCQQAVDILMQGYTATKNDRLLLQYRARTPKAPTASAEGGNYGTPITVTLTAESPVYYTLDGSLPNTTSAIATAPITLDQSGTYVLRAVTFNDKDVRSDECTQIYILDIPYVPTESVVLNRETITLKKGETYQLTATVHPENATNRQILWSSSDPEKVTVDETGLVTMVSGTATVTATVVGETVQGTCKVNLPVTTVKPSEVDVNSVSFKDRQDELAHDAAINDDAVAWIYLPGPTSVTGLPIDSSILQYTNNTYYLDHDIYGATSYNGWIYMDRSNSTPELDKVTVLFGHARSKKAFWGIKKLEQYPAWYNNANNHFIQISTTTGEYLYQVFSWYITNTSVNYLQKKFTDDAEYLNFLKVIQNRNQLPNLAKFEFTATDRILTLSTCRGTDETVRVAVHAKLVRYEPVN